jgi:hypothetical protein
MQQHHRIVVDVDHLRGRVHLVRDLVDVAAARQAGADVQELRDPGLAGQEPDHPAQQRPVGLRPCGGVGRDLQGQLDDIPVHGEVVLAVQERVVDAGDVRLGDVDTRRNWLPTSHRRLLTFCAVCADTLPSAAAQTHVHQGCGQRR